MPSRLALDSCSFSFHISHLGITGGYHHPGVILSFLKDSSASTFILEEPE